MLRIGVLGAGYLGKIHIELILKIPEFDLVGFYDPDTTTSYEITQKYGIKAFNSPNELLLEVDAIDIVTPTISHFDCAVEALKNDKHLFIEKPITYTPDEARQLIKLNNEAGVVIQVGHVERFNPGFIAAKPFITNPMFIEAHRLGQFNPRGTDVPVVLDLMIHDIDIVLNIVNSGVRKISANGVAVIGDTPDIANARLEFNNGCVANLTASRISVNKMRKHRIFQQDAYIIIDFLKKDAEIFRLLNNTPDKSPLFSFNNGLENKSVIIDKPEIIYTNAIEEELRSFHKSIYEKLPSVVSIDEGFDALNIAQQILDKLKNGINSY